MKEVTFFLDFPKHIHRLEFDSISQGGF